MLDRSCTKGILVNTIRYCLRNSSFSSSYVVMDPAEIDPNQSLAGPCSVEGKVTHLMTYVAFQPNIPKSQLYRRFRRSVDPSNISIFNGLPSSPVSLTDLVSVEKGDRVVYGTFIGGKFLYLLGS